MASTNIVVQVDGFFFEWLQQLCHYHTNLITSLSNEVTLFLQSMNGLICLKGATQFETLDIH